MGSPVTHWQILSKNPESSEKFYAQLFGWKVSSDNALSYRKVDTGNPQGINGGIWPIAVNEGYPMVQLFIRVESVDQYLQKATALGARVVVPAQTLPAGDVMAVAVDPEGIPFAIFEGAGTNPN